MIAMSHGHALISVILVCSVSLGGTLFLVWLHRPVSCPRCGEKQRDDGQPHFGPVTCARCGTRYNGVSGKPKA